MQEFNKGVYDYIIAVDEGGEQDNEDSEHSDAEEQSDEERRTFL